MTLHWTISPLDGALIEARTEFVVFHICDTANRVTWWSEFCDHPHDVRNVQEAKEAVEAALAAFEISMSFDKQIKDAGVPMLIWPFKTAPGAIKNLSTHGGDEDWAVYLPAAIVKDHGIPYFMETAPFAICDLREIKVIDGSCILIAAHA